MDIKGVFLRWIIILMTAISGVLWASGPGDEHWDGQFGAVGANNEVFSIAVCSGHVYVLGTTITAAGNGKVNYLAAFDGTNWSPLGAGVLAQANAPMTAVGTDGTSVYVGGLFTNADISGAQDNAKWDGTNWSVVGDGTLSGPGFVYRKFGNNLYIGGVFATAGTNTVNNIVCWTGTNWAPLGSGVSGCTGQFCSSSVIALESQNGNIYAGGNFTSAGGTDASYVAYYDGQAWHAMNNPFNGQVEALKFFEGYLYAGGAFTNDGLDITNFARWDGSGWSAVPGGGANGTVESLETDGTNLYVGGFFSTICGIAAQGVAEFDGASWNTLGTGLESFGTAEVYRMSAQSNGLYVGGIFTVAGTEGASFVAFWDRTNWHGLGGQVAKGITYPTGGINAMTSYQNSLYVGGYFNNAGSLVTSNLAVWDGTNWSGFGIGATGALPGYRNFVNALTTLNLRTPTNIDLYIGGNFTTVDGVAAQCVAHWDGESWSPLGSGTDSSVLALAGVDSILYVGGYFTNAGGIYSPGFAEWIEGGWYGTGGVAGGSATVYAVAVDSGANAYVGGNFTSGGVTALSNIGYYDGSSWTALGTGVNGTVRALADNGSMLYAGGTFTSAGSVSASHIAQWDGTSWSALGSGINGNVYALAILGTNLYAAGSFTTAGGITASNIAKWNGSAWSALGSGLGKPQVFALAANGNDLYAGGSFTFAGDKPSQFVAHWNDEENFYPTAAMQLFRSGWLTNGQFGFQLRGTSGQYYIIQGSTNLQTWTPLVTNSAVFYDFSDPSARTTPTKYYRAVLGPP